MMVGTAALGPVAAPASGAEGSGAPRAPLAPKKSPPPLAAESKEGLLYDDLPGGMSAYTITSRWSRTDLTYFFQNGTGDIADPGEREAVRQAFDLWSIYSPLTFTEGFSAATSDISVFWGAGDHGDGYPFDGQNGVLAHAFFPENGDVHFDDDEVWTVSIQGGGYQPIDLVTVAAHEIGHSLGLGHSTRTDALMYPYYAGSHRYLSQDDVDGIQLNYSPPPANDAFARPQVLSGSAGTVAGGNVAATKEGGEPSHAGNLGGSSIWYRWTAPVTGQVTFDTYGSGFDTLLGVYTGSAVNALNVVAQNDDAPGLLSSRVGPVDVTAGTVYRIAVDGYNRAMGSVSLGWSFQPELPVLSVGDATVREGHSGGRAARVTVSLSKPSTSTVTVGYATADGSATAPGDYTARSGTLIFAPGTRSTAIAVTTAGDASTEGSESFTVNLASPTNAVLGDASGGITLENDDPPGRARRVSVGDASVVEGDEGARLVRLTVTLSKPASVATVTVGYVTGDGSAVAPGDYTAKSGTLSFAPGQLSKAISVSVIADELAEGSDQFTVTLFSPTNASLGDGFGTATIADDDS